MGADNHVVDGMREQILMDAAMGLLDTTIGFIHELEADNRLALSTTARKALRDLKRTVSSCEYTFSNLQNGKADEAARTRAG
jgi:hypothetical protein